MMHSLLYFRSGVRASVCRRSWTFLVVALLASALVPAEAATLTSHQSGTATISNGSPSTMVGIAPVDLSRAFLVFGLSGSQTNPAEIQVSGQLTGPGQITFIRDGSEGNIGSIDLHWYVVEFLGITVQRGSASIDSTVASASVSIAPVNLAKTFPMISIRKAGKSFRATDFAQASLPGSTTLQIDLGGIPSPGTVVEVEWQVVEWSDSSVSSGSTGMGSASFSAPTVTPPAFDPAKPGFCTAIRWPAGGQHPWGKTSSAGD